MMCTFYIKVEFRTGGWLDIDLIRNVVVYLLRSICKTVKVSGNKMEKESTEDQRL